MKRLSVIFIAIFILAAGGSLAAFDVGGSLTSGTDLSTLDVVGAATEAKVGLWLESGKGEHYSFEMKLDLTAAFTDDGFDFFFNPDYLKLDSPVGTTLITAPRSTRRVSDASQHRILPVGYSRRSSTV